MATSSFEMVVGARFLTTSSAHRTASFLMSGGPMFSIDPYGSSAFTRSATQRKAWLPGARTPVLNPDGTMRPEWYRAFDYLFNQRLGGIEGPSMAEVQTNVVETKNAAVNAAVAATAVEVMTVANAEALKAVVEVAQNAELPGSTSVPQVIVRSPTTRYAEF